jgi:diguanylate cyclase (GGDEF)-like protein
MNGEPGTPIEMTGSTPPPARAKGLRDVIKSAQEIESKRVKERPNESRVLTRKHAVAAAMLEHQTNKLKKAEVDADHDSLTGLLNRRGFEEVFPREIAIINRLHVKEDESGVGHQDSKASVLFLDINKFKEVNDLISHDAGDARLVEFAKILQASVRKSDIVVRWGGDEFLIVLPGNDLAASKIYWESRLKRMLTDGKFLVSVGLCEIDPKFPQASLPLADELQKQAKNISRANSDSTQLVPAEQ